MVSELKEKAEAHREVYYLYHDINDLWMNVIGANALVGVPEVSTYHHCTCNIDQGTYVTTETIPNVQSEAGCTDPNALNCTYSSYLTTTYTPTWVEKPSDGVVLQESAQYMTGATWPSELLRVRFNDTGIPNELNTGSSHMQARNDRNTRDALRALYDGSMDPFFETAIK